MIDKDGNREAMRKELASRVEAAISDNYKTKQETQKRKKCTVCGKGYLGQVGASTCGPTCRKRKSRA